MKQVMGLKYCTKFLPVPNTPACCSRSGYQSGSHSGYQSGSSSSGYPDNFSSPSLESNSVSSEEESSPQALRRNPNPPSLAAESSSCESSDGSSTRGPYIKKSGGESSSIKLSTGMSDSGLSTMGASDQEEEPNLPTGKRREACFQTQLSCFFLLSLRPHEVVLRRCAFVAGHHGEKSSSSRS